MLRRLGALGLPIVAGLLGLLGLLAILPSLSTSAGEDTAEKSDTSPDPLTTLGFQVTGGAAPGYVEDRACALCHNDLWRSYQNVGMARSFARPRAELMVEDFRPGDPTAEGRSRPFHHKPSGHWFQMQWRDDRLTFRRWLEDEEGRRVHLLELEVDWIMGSAHTSRVYLYQTAADALFQLPLAWYSQDSRGKVTTDSGHWGMAPGYDRPNHQGIQRQVRRECMFCHNAYPDVPAGSDVYGEPHLFPDSLPQGIGCQRCHGPGAHHVRTALGAQDPEQQSETTGHNLEQALRATIVNPGRLSPARRNDVCFGCHFQPTVAIHGVRRFERPDYSLRPGDTLSDYLLKVDIHEQDRRRDERFEINHHAYRLLQSACFQESQDHDPALSCLTCHDPHRRVPAEERLEHYRRACLSCHPVDSCQLEEMGAPAGMEGVDPRDCTHCHMPRRRTQDVVQVVMTDHRIQPRPPGSERLAPLEEEDPTITDVEVLDPPPGTLAEAYRIIAYLRTSAVTAEAVQRLEEALEASRPGSNTPYLDLARAQLRLRWLSAAEATLRRVLDEEPDKDRAMSWMSIVKAGQGDRGAALAWARRALKVEPRHAEYHFNLGRLLLGYHRPADAVPHLERAVELRPVLVPAWVQLGQALAATGEDEEARAARRRLLRIDPQQVQAGHGDPTLHSQRHDP